MEPPKPAPFGGPAAPARPAAAAPAGSGGQPAADEKDPAYKRSHFGLWCLDLLENMVQVAKEASAIERFDNLGSAFHKHLNGQFAVTFAAFQVGAEEKLVVEGVDHRLFSLEDLLLFFKTSEGFLDPKEELKVVRKRYGALFVLLKMSLRLSRGGLLGFTLEPKVPAEALKPLALLFREEPLATPPQEHQRLHGELKRRDIRGVSLISQSDRVTQGHMSAGARVLLTLLKRGLPALTDRKQLEVYAASYAKVGGPAITSELVINLEHIVPPEQRELVKHAIIGGLSVAELLAWRDHLEKLGEELAALSLKETDPTRRAGLEAKLKALPGLLKAVIDKIPPETLEKEAAARREKFAAAQDAKSEQEVLRRSKEAAASLDQDDRPFVARLVNEEDPQLYPPLLRQAIDAFIHLQYDNVEVAQDIAAALLKHRTDASLPWRRDAAGAALRELGTKKQVHRLVELLKSEKPEGRKLARVALAAIGEPSVAQVWAALLVAEDSAALLTVLKEIGAAGEPAIAQLLTQGGSTLPPGVVRAGLEVLATVKNPARFDFVSAYTRHPDTAVREQAFRALVAMDAGKAQAVVKRHIGDRDVALAATCLLLMGELRTNDPYVVKQMLDTLKRREKDQPEPDDRLQVASAKALARLGNFKFGDTTLEDYLLALVKPKEKKLLGFGGDKLKEKSDAVRAAVCEAVGIFGGEASMQMLRTLAMEDPHDVVKSAARTGLHHMAQRAKKA